ncbi:MAG: hypothetical protein R6V35_03835 [Candidatus Nanohaloarchaea archaeon]
MSQRVAEQIPVEEYSSHNVQSYEVPELEAIEGLSGLVFNLPYSSSGFDSRPVLCIYGSEDLSGYFFNGESDHQDTLFGLEGPGEADVLDSGDYPVKEIDPFLGRNDNLGDGFRRYKIPIKDDWSYEVVAEIRPDEREKEKMLLNSFTEDTKVSQLIIGRTKDGWDFLSGTPQKVSKRVK